MANITTSVIPLSANDLIRPGAGVEWWNGQDYADVPAVGNRATRTDFYFRFCWTDIEHTSQGNYVWTRFDSEFQKAINVGAKFSFGFMIVCDSDSFLREEFFNGVSARYPLYVHNKMQSESVHDYTTNGQWIPNWNSAFFWERFQAMLIAVRDHVIAKGWEKYIGYVDVRGYGQWGEWHSVGFGQPVTSQPSGTRITVDSYKKCVNAHLLAFPNWQLVMMLAAMDAEWLDNTMTPREITDFVLKASNNKGPLGLRRDQWGATDNYIHDYLENNNRSFGTSGPFKDIIMQRWKTSPWVGEPMGPGSNLSDLLRQVTFYHATSFGNGNYTKGVTTDAQVREAAKNAGYRLQIENGVYTNTNTSATITLNWRNSGVAPTYEDWDVQLLIKNSAGNVVSTSISSFKPKRFLPSSMVTPITDVINFSLPQGNYILAVKVIDIAGVRKPMPLFISGVQTDGSYHLGTITVTTGTPNQAPTANAGPDKSITLPTSAVALAGTGSDPEGSPLTYAWTQVSGPSTATIQSPSSPTTNVSGLTAAGAYVFQLRVSDNQNASAIDSATVTVKPEVNVPPVVSAGQDQVITLPVNTATLTATVNDTDPVTTTWSKVSGSGNIASPSTLSTQIINLVQGISIFRITVRDTAGNTRTDDVQITVNSAPVTPPRKVVTIVVLTATYRVTYDDGTSENITM